MELKWQRQQEQPNTSSKHTERFGKLKREIQIEAYERAIAEADDGMLDTLEELQRKAQVRQAGIYLDTYFKATNEGKSKYVAENLANNDLTRAGLQRVDGKNTRFRDDRDKEVWEMEQQILQKARSEMTPEELEQLEIWEEHEKALREKGKKLGR